MSNVDLAKDFYVGNERLKELRRRGHAMIIIENILAKIDSMTQRLDAGLVPEKDIEATTALRDGMKHGLDLLRIEEYDSKNRRREAIMEQRERNDA